VVRRYSGMPSSVISAFDYEPEACRLTILFTSGRTYVYDDVPEVIANDFRRAYSKDAFFNRCIHDHYRYRETRPKSA
jgi:hypothetical protein